ncbi:hypothetical protein SAMN06272735_8604 [Streptomyces sp. TLI_55]|nr:hypothetical protein [Streptomyces sp. TLI_55]SNX88168.1 hypothetical protein SAMN06272735_8604 [Streptomyces sp. TLI_55]
MGLSQDVVRRHVRNGKARIEQAVPSLLKKTPDTVPDDHHERDTKE